MTRSTGGEAVATAVTAGGHAGAPPAAADAIDRALAGLLAKQHEDGYWCAEFEADCTIPAEYILMVHYLDEPEFMDDLDPDLEQKIAAYLRARQAEHGGWPLYHGGALDISGSVKAYYALKLAGDAPDQPHMRRAREAILAHGGAARANVFTRITLALFGQLPWRAVPVVPVELILFPRWFPLNLQRIAYWSRTVTVPLSILCSLKPPARNPRGVQVRELFTVPPEEETAYFTSRSRLGRLFLLLDAIARRVEPWIPGWLRRRALRKAEAWILERSNGVNGLGAIFPAMVNAYEALVRLGYGPDHEHRRTASEALKRLVVVREEEAYCQPCVSPVWDTGLACLAIQSIPGRERDESVIRALDWLVPRQLREEPGDWRGCRPDLPGGGWPFQFGNDHYPDLDDTAVVGWAMWLADPERYREAIGRAAGWIEGMQSRNGGFASFEVDNTDDYLNEVPFADHGALLDPPTSDVTARCVAFLARLDEPRYRPAIERAVGFLRGEQEASGCWFGRWGTNYIYGTWSVLSALELAKRDPSDRMIRRAVAWLERRQRDDGSWGETNDSYLDPALAGRAGRGTAFQTAWAVLALIAAGQSGSSAAARGVEYLRRTQNPDGLWYDPEFTCPGFPRVFYLKYHGYTDYFPLWALARFRHSDAAEAGAR